MRSNLSRLVLSGASCTSPLGNCYVVDDRVVIEVTSPSDIVSFTLTRGSCSADISIEMPCTVGGYVVVKFSDHGYRS